MEKAFKELGFSDEGIKEGITRLQRGETIILPDKQNLLKIDIMGFYSSYVTFKEAYKTRVIMDIGDIKVSVLSLDQLIETKIKSGREQDVLDAKNLAKIREKKKNL